MSSTVLSFQPTKKQYKHSTRWPAPLGVIGNITFSKH